MITKKKQIGTNEYDQESEGLNQLFEIINAQGDKGELEEIVSKGTNEKLLCSEELFNKELRAIVDDTLNVND
jgi:hypothetical protein